MRTSRIGVFAATTALATAAALGGAGVAQADPLEEIDLGSLNPTSPLGLVIDEIDDDEIEGVLANNTEGALTDCAVIVGAEDDVRAVEAGEADELEGVEGTVDEDEIEPAVVVEWETEDVVESPVGAMAECTDEEGEQLTAFAYEDEQLLEVLGSLEDLEDVGDPASLADIVDPASLEEIDAAGSLGDIIGDDDADDEDEGDADEDGDDSDDEGDDDEAVPTPA